MKPSSTSNSRRIALSVGEPAGIGPDICLALSRRDWPVELVLVADRQMLLERAECLGINVELLSYNADSLRQSTAGRLSVLHTPLAEPVVAGAPSPANARGVLRALDTAALGCLKGEFAALVTAPINKAVISDSGVRFTGHTEYLAAITGTERVVMLLAAPALRVALATTHLPLAEVPGAISIEGLLRTLRILDADLRGKFAIAEPRISVLGLNPHAGDGGHLGQEDDAIVAPALEAARAEGMHVSGPWPADTAFNAKLLKNTDAYLAMYHDQGLPVLKYASFGAAVNITLGLPIVRTSVDHGTAFDIAGSGEADSSSMIAALESALDLAKVSPGFRQ